MKNSKPHPYMLRHGVASDDILRRQRTIVQMKAMEHGGTEAQKVAWILERDRQTRLAAMTLFQDKYPWGEALQVARDSRCAVLWT